MIPSALRCGLQALGQSETEAASMQQLTDKPVSPERGALGGWVMGFQQVLLGLHPRFGVSAKGNKGNRYFTR
jgi:hypothetical protein